MTTQPKTVRTGDASGRGGADEFKVPFPPKMAPSERLATSAVPPPSLASRTRIEPRASRKQLCPGWPWRKTT